MARVNRKPLTHNNKVIPFPNVGPWRFFDFCFSKTANPIQAWYLSSLSDEGRSLFDAHLKNSRKTSSPDHWGGFQFLKGKPRQYKIWEIKFKADRKQYRVLGRFGDARRQAILLLGCYHKDHVYTPAGSFEQVCRRARMLEDRQAVIYERPVNDDI